MARFVWGAATDVGRLRTANEDAFCADDRLFVVADGMGGHLAGEVAAAMAVDALRDRMSGAVTGDIDALIGAVDTANRQIFQASHTRVDQHGMGTTLTAIAPVRVDGEAQLGLVNVGDSRAYAVRRGRLTQLSIDHSYVQELIASGQITAMEARAHPHRNIVTRALGIEPVVRIDAWTMPIVAGDRFILCSDGLVDEVLDTVIGELAADILDPQEAADRLVAAANRNGGRDNITVVVIDVIEGADTQELTLDLEPHRSGEMHAESRWADDRSGDVTPSGVVGAGAAALRIVPADPADAIDAVAGVDLGPEGDDITRAFGRPTDARRAGAAAPDSADFAPPSAHELVSDADVDAFADDPIDDPTDGRRRTPGSRRPFTLGSIAFLTAVAAVFVVGFVMIAAYARSGYFVDYRGDEIVVYKGRPGGVLWFDPTVAAIAPQKKSELPPGDAEGLANQPEFDSVDLAISYIETHSTTAPGISVVTSVPASTTPVPTIGSIDGGATTDTTIAPTAPALPSVDTATATTIAIVTGSSSP